MSKNNLIVHLCLIAGALVFAFWSGWIKWGDFQQTLWSILGIVVLLPIFAWAFVNPVVQYMTATAQAKRVVREWQGQGVPEVPLFSQWSQVVGEDLHWTDPSLLFELAADISHKFSNLANTSTFCFKPLVRMPNSDVSLTHVPLKGSVVVGQDYASLGVARYFSTNFAGTGSGFMFLWVRLRFVGNGLEWRLVGSYLCAWTPVVGVHDGSFGVDGQQFLTTVSEVVHRAVGEIGSQPTRQPSVGLIELEDI